MGNKEKSEVVLENDLNKFSLISIFLIIFSIGFALRFYYSPFEIPIILDGLLYFWYANDIAITGTLPLDYSPANNGWPIFLSIFFQILNSENFLDYMVVQRSLTIILSSLTVIPLYYICRKFFSQKFALLGILLFSFEPRIIQNAGLGVTEPLFILLITISILCFLNEKKPINFIAFPLIAFATIVRSEAIVLLIPYSFLYIIKFRKSKRVFYELPLFVMFFFLIILPMVDYRETVTGSDTIFSRILDEGKKYMIDENNNLEFDSSNRFSEIKNMFLMTGWASIPFFLFLIPFGLYGFIKQRIFDNYSILTILLFLAIPALHAISYLPDTKYLYILYPILCLISIKSLQKVSNYFHKKKYVLTIIATIVLISSISFLEIKKNDSEHEIEALKIAEIISEKTIAINQYTTESGYLPIIGMKELNEFPITRMDFVNKESNMKNCFNIHACQYIIPIKTNDIVEFLKNSQDKGITHLIIDDKEERRASFNHEIFYNEEKFLYLKKIYDSNDQNLSYHVKIFEIDFEKFNKINN